MVYDTLDKHLFGAELHNQDKTFVFELFIQILYYFMKCNVIGLNENRINLLTLHEAHIICPLAQANMGGFLGTIKHTGHSKYSRKSSVEITLF